MFELFKQQKSFLTRAKEMTSLKYLLSYDTNGSFIEVVDKKNSPLKNVDYRVYSGNDREILQLIEKIRENDFFNINWEKSSENIYLNDHPKLIELLKKSDKFYNDKDELIVFIPNTYEIELIISEKDSDYRAYSTVNGNETYSFVSSKYVLVGNEIVKISDIGENFNMLSTFNTTFSSNKLEEFLTIFVTYFENICIKYRDYSITNYDEKKLIKPSIFFEKVTAENELVLKVSATIGKLTPDFFNSFNISKIVLVNDLESIISIYECDFSEVFQVYADIYKNLNSLKRKIKDVNFSEEDGLFIIEDKLAIEFIENNLNEYIGICELYGNDRLKSYKFSTNKPSLKVSFGNKIDLLGLDDVKVEIGADIFNLFDLIKLYKKNSFITLSSGEKSIIDKSYISKLERIFKKKGDEIKVSFFDLPEIEEIISEKEQAVFKKSKSFYENFNSLAKSSKRLPKVNAKLRDYQKYGVRWLKYLYDNNFGGCLADDMGLGKTLQAISLLSYIYPKEKKPSIIIMPKSLLINWQNELNKFNNNLSYYLYYGTNRDIKEITKNNITLTTYAMVRNDIETLKEIDFDTIILDESQNIKNIDSMISKAVMLLSSTHRFALSGTPIENSLYELYSLFRFLNAGMFSSVNDFKRDYVLPIQLDANEEIAHVLKAKISPFLLRRLKSSVLTDLPEKQEQVIYVDMDDKHREFYEKTKAYHKNILDKQIESDGIEKSKFAIFQAFNDLRQIASVPELKAEETIVSSKIETLFDNLEDIVANNHKVLIFANYLGSLDVIAQKADELGYDYLTMTGSTRNRQELVDRFQNDKKISLFLMTLKVGGVGLNLTEADYVFIFDPWWNRSAENQAVDRTHRIGQKNRVFSYRMITKDTIEEKILELQEQKQDLTDKILSGDDGSLKTLSKSDLDFILG